MSHRLLPLLVVVLGLGACLSACATSRPPAPEGVSTTEWVMAAPVLRVAEAFAATRDSVGLRLAEDAAGSPANGAAVHLSGRNAFGRVTVELSDAGPAGTRARVRLVYPLPFAHETPMLHLQWANEAGERLGEGAAAALVPERIWPEDAVSCAERGTSDLNGRGVTPPMLVWAGEPAYTGEALRRRFEGRVQVHLLVDASGAVACALVASGLPYGLSDAALDAVRLWRFRPATRGGAPVAAFGIVSVVFRVPSTYLPPPNTSGSVACGGTYTNDSAVNCRDERPSSFPNPTGGN